MEATLGRIWTKKKIEKTKFKFFNFIFLNFVKGSGLSQVAPLPSTFIYFLCVFVAVLLGTLTVQNSKEWSANNVELRWRLSHKSLMYIRNESRPNIKPWETSALILAQDELWALRITLFLYFLKNLSKGFRNFLRSHCI